MVVLIFHPIVQLALFGHFFTQMYIAIQPEFAPPFTKKLLEPVEPIATDVIMSIMLLTYTKLFPFEQLSREYPSA